MASLHYPRLRPYGPYDVAQGMPRSSSLQFLGVWSGPMALAESRPVYVCLQTIYGLNSGVFLSTLPTYALSLPGRGLALRPERVYTPIDMIFAHFSAPEDMCICMLSVDDQSLKNGQLVPRGDTNWNTKAP